MKDNLKKIMLQNITVKIKTKTIIKTMVVAPLWVQPSSILNKRYESLAIHLSFLVCIQYKSGNWDGNINEPIYASCSLK